MLENSLIYGGLQQRLSLPEYIVFFYCCPHEKDNTEGMHKDFFYLQFSQKNHKSCYKCSLSFLFSFSTVLCHLSI